MDKVTIKDLLAKKEAIIDKKKKPATAQLFVKSLGGTITIQKPSKALCFDALEMDQNGDSYLVYNCVVEPNLKDGELQKEFGCVSPMDIVELLFEPGEISAIAKECVELAGYGDSVKVVDDLKN